MELLKAVQKKKKVKVSKNKKKNWRKHTTFEDAEEFLADQQLQERTGGIAADKPDEQLFFVDSKAETEEPKGKKRKQKKDVSAIYRNLLPDSEPAPETKRHKKVTEKRLKLAVKTVGRRGGGNQPKPKKNPTELYNPTEDLWAEPAAVPEIMQHHNRITRQTRVKRLAYTAKFKPSTVPAVQAPHPGASYNPDPEAFKELLREAHEVEVVKEAAEVKLKRKMDDMFPDRKNAPSEASYLREMSAGLGGAVEGAESSSEEEEEEGGEEEEWRVSVGKPSNRDKKKTPQQRRKTAERKRQALKEKLEKALEAKERQMYRLRSIKKNIVAEDIQKADREWRKATEKAESVGKTKKLGKIRYEEPEVEVKLSGELVGSLRLLKPEGHLLEDRYKSLQKRNIIEPREKQTRKLKHKMKKFEKAGHKAVTLQS